ncbi:hypothetical protein [Streptomyces purpureus]|uniref:Secreted protein n=1 Tax=Streptomyces purpureus TaxID=1951 RepID=A0A918LM37_9ACTN|nr:hypothetical protein [Streptomyces purpureus]GGT15467.1 hypothetical protein GCM10014713_05330 [Streptomyces purpureus]
MIRVPRMATAATAVLALAVGAPGLAYASPQSAPAQPAAGPLSAVPPGNPDDRLPEGWQITGTDAGPQLVWQSPRPVPMGDARVEFYAGDTLLGRPEAAKDGRTFRLTLDGAHVGPSSDLRVLAGGRRLDTAGAEDAADRRGRAKRPVPPPAAELPAHSVDPGLPGTYRTTSGEYSLKDVRLPGFSAPVEMRASVVAPTGVSGPRPLALFLHGRHYTCYGAESSQTAEWPCKPGSKPVPSHRGYLHDQKLLASQGYVTVSISANGINAQDHSADDGGAQARSSLVRLHLARWADWAADPAKAPAAVRAASPADLSRVLLVGHSRGGEGVNRAALDSLTKAPADQDGYRGTVRWKIRGTVLTGPTIFGQNPVPDVPSMTLLPGCDGDVSDLQGQIYVDGTRGISRGAALHSAVYMVGANHNFFNSEWTPGQAEAPADDDFYTGETPDPVCSPGTKTRLTAAQQQKAGSTYIAAAARLFVAGDDRVRPLLDGSNLRAPSAGPARVLTHAVGGHRTPAFLPDASVKVTGGRLCAQVDPEGPDGCLPGDGSVGSSPHFATWETAPEPGRYAVAMRWTRAGHATRVTPAGPVSLAGSKALALRVFVPPNTTGTKLDIALTDAAGKRATLGRVTVDGLPGSDRTTSLWGREIRVPLTKAVRAGLDLKKVAALELTPRSRSGQAWLMDGWGWRAGTPVVRPATLPRVDIGRLTVKEGDSGVRTYRVPVKVSGPGTGQVRLFVAEPGAAATTSRVVTVGAGASAIDVPVKVKGNTRYGSDVSRNVFVKAVRGVVVGAHLGGVTARNDDPMPKVTVTPVADRVTEGKALKWRVSLSETADTDLPVGFLLLPVSGGKELSTKDVPKSWLEEHFGGSPSPARPLSKVVQEPYLSAFVPAGKAGTEVSVPTVRDTLNEPEESLRMRMITYDESWEPVEGPAFTGTVRNAS